MIDDPIRLTCHPNHEFFVAQRAIGKTEIFVIIEEPNGGLKAIYLFDAVLSDLADYHIKFVGNPASRCWWAAGRIGAENIIKKEAFLLHVMDNYPDHFEWLLFHLEWM